MIDFGIIFGAIWAPTWDLLEAQVGAMLGSKTALESPKMPPKTRLGARPRPGPKKGSKMKPQCSQQLTTWCPEASKKQSECQGRVLLAKRLLKFTKICANGAKMARRCFQNGAQKAPKS